MRRHLKPPLDVTLCEEAFFRFAVPTKLTPNWLSVLVDNLPGTKLNAESVERIKRRHSSQEQTFQLLFVVWMMFPFGNYCWTEKVFIK